MWVDAIYHLLLIEKELRCGWPTRSDNQTLCIVGLEICFQSMLIFKYGCFQYSGNFVQTKYRCQTEDPTQKVLRCHLLFLTLSASLCKPVYLGKWRTSLHCPSPPSTPTFPAMLPHTASICAFQEKTFSKMQSNRETVKALWNLYLLKYTPEKQIK